MAEGKTGRGLTPEQWQEVRALYEDGASILSLSQRYHVTRTAIMAHRDKECWIPKAVTPSPHDRRTGSRAILNEARSNVVDMKTRELLERIDPAATAAIAEELLAATNVIKSAALATTAFMEKLASGKVKPAKKPGEQSEADVFKTGMAAASMFLKMVRESHGLTPGMPTGIADDPDEMPIGEVRKTVKAKPADALSA